MNVKKKTRPTRSETTRRRIVDAALRVFARRGYHEATMDDIAAASRLSKGALYLYFPSKQDLFLSLIDSLADMLVRRMEAAMNAAGPSRRQKLRAALEAGFRLFERHRPVVRLIFLKLASLGPPLDVKQAEIQDRIAALIQQELDAAVAEGSLAVDDTETVARMWVGAIHAILVDWLHQRKPLPLRQKFPTVYATLLRSIGLEEISRPVGR
ncbi:MAG: TetR/AcrR family transcriptional regulator [Acidobacteria bacterium]|nr:TetR/AcrR family transcriptional regulator [Acidobacteriota bacterium]MDW7983844.1 TetR/AcrR family transcriptional regulator [Acidobacteriota bacterium]